MSPEQRTLIRLQGVGVTFRSRRGPLSVERIEALSGIDLEIRSGETLGIMGPNGSGKSTLLKVLARIYQQDTGRVDFSTDSISLLSLSVGFDLELSGRDNAILSSMLLGSSLREARARLDDIIEFSELGEFAHRPVKTYSTGMRSRLGFAVALNMRADVLLIDEVLAVGDAHFRKKSERAIRDKMSSDQTVVLVSHSAQMIQSLCDRVVALEHGRIRAEGSPAEICE